MFFARQCRNINSTHRTRYAPVRRYFRDGFSILLAGRTAQHVIEVSGMQTQLWIALPRPTQAAQEMQKAQRIRPARNGDNNFAAARKEMVFFNIGGDTVWYIHCVDFDKGISGNFWVITGDI